MTTVQFGDLDFVSLIVMQFVIYALVVLSASVYPTSSIGLRLHAIVLNGLRVLIEIVAAAVVVDRLECQCLR